MKRRFCSVLDQHYKPLEYILIDGGSTHESYAASEAGNKGKRAFVASRAGASSRKPRAKTVLVLSAEAREQTTAHSPNG